jgi:hypothetical protein
LINDKKPRWIDPEFGPNANDQYGAKGMYISDNLIPEGSPKPEECNWLRPEEIIKGRIAYGEDIYECNEFS